VPWPESDRIILTAYPPMALLDDGKTVCPDGQALLTSIRNLLRSNMRHASTDITFCPAETPAKHETDTGA
jgi:hypothetical protein